ncbi:MAG: NFACT family protein [Oscillospiraceae bacterium]|nr:NFACT family protein [Oscillospiraceae bacterium]
MSLDGAFLHIVKTELIEKNIIGARVDKIHQPSRDEVVISFRASGSNLRLLMSANPASSRICLVGSPQSAGLSTGEAGQPAVAHRPPMFCTVLRKHLGSGKLTAITQDGLERILFLDFACHNEIGDPVNNRLIVEIMGRTNNIILINADTGRIIDCLKRTHDAVSSLRRLLPNFPYEPPPKDNRYCLLDCDIDNIEWAENDKSLMKMLEGVSPIFAREAVHCGVVEFLKKAQTALLTNTPTITRVDNSDFCFMNITQYGDTLPIFYENSANELLDKFFAEKSNAERLKQRSGSLMKSLKNTHERVQRKLAVQKQELLDCKDRERFKIYGDLINANIYRLNKGDTFVEAENYITNETVKIKLDERLSPAQNAQKYYSSYRKLSNAEKMLIKLIADGERELLYLESVIDSAERAETDSEMDEIRGEINKPVSSKNQKKSKPLQPIKYTLDNTEILVGRNNRQNDELTFKLAKPDDIWLHTKDIAGSHVILRCSGKTPDDETIHHAAQIAAYHSKGQNSNQVPVDYTLVRYVKKPSGSKPGYVIFTNNKTLYVTPERTFKNNETT